MYNLRTISLFLLITVCLTACHSGRSESPATNGDSTVSAKNTFPGIAHIADNKYVVLTMTADSSRAAGAPVVVTAGTLHLYCSGVSAIQPDSISAQFRSLMNQEIRVCNADGTSYLTNITGFERYYIVIPHFGKRRWRNENGNHSKQMARNISREVTACLVAEFAPKGEGALYALPAGIPVSALLSMSYKADALEKTCGPALRKQAGYNAAHFKHDHAIPWNEKTASQRVTFYSSNDERAILKQAGNEWIETCEWKIPNHDCLL